MPEANNDVGNEIEESRWQFMITGGVDFDMPITVFQVTEGGKADRVGLKLGDSIIQINEQDTRDMALHEAQKLIEVSSESQLKLKVQNVDDEEQTEHAPVREILLQTEKKPKKVESKDGSPQPNLPVAQWIPKPERRAWHPVMWQETQSDHHNNQKHQIRQTPAEGAPHARIIRNIRRLLTETENNPEERQKHIEHMLLALPTASKI